MWLTTRFSCFSYFLRCLQSQSLSCFIRHPLSRFLSYIIYLYYWLLYSYECFKKRFQVGLWLSFLTETEIWDWRGAIFSICQSNNYSYLCHCLRAYYARARRALPLAHKSHAFHLGRIFRWGLADNENDECTTWELVRRKFMRWRSWIRIILRNNEIMWTTWIPKRNIMVTVG